MRIVPIFKRALSVAVLMSTVALRASDEVTPTLVLRSQGRHADRQKMVGMTNQTHLTDQDSSYGTFDIGVGYSRSFRGDRLARCLFGSDVICDCGPQILVQGSNVENADIVEERDPKAWLADYLYLNCDFNGFFKVEPKIQNVTVDLDFYLTNECLDGLYFRLYGPITWTKWKTGFCSTSETSVTDSCQFGGAGYFTSDGSEEFLSKLSDYFDGKSPEPAAGTSFQQLRFAKMPACDQTKTGFADLRAEIGYDFLRNEDYALGINVQGAAATGNKRRAEFVMNPVVGNGNHWELGGGVTGHYVFWRGENEDQSFGFYLDANFTHLFYSTEQRTFDLKGKPNSRYMLAAKMTKNVSTNNGIANLGGQNNAGVVVVATEVPTAALYQFDNEYAPVANLTTLDVRVNVGVQADIVAMFNYQRDNFGFDFGYNFWGRSCENIKCPLICNPCDESLCALNGKDKWVLKGDARMFGYTGLVTTAKALSSSQSGADIHGGTNVNAVDASLTNARLQNAGVDNALFAVNGVTNGSDRLIHTPTNFGGIVADSNQVKTSIQPVILSCDDIDLQRTRGISHTLFAHLSYTWDKENCTPYIGFGGSVEFGNAKSCCDTDNKCCEDDCNNCLSCALSQWGLWVKGGISWD